MSLAAFLAGAATYGWSWLQLRRLQVLQPTSDGLGFAAVARANELTTLSRVGLALMGAGALVAVLAAAVARSGADD